MQKHINPQSSSSKMTMESQRDVENTVVTSDLPIPRKTPSRLGVPIIILGSLIVSAPSLWWGFMLDDYGQQIILRGVGDHPTMRPWALYDFGGLPPRHSQAWKLGGYPWWCGGDWHVRFFRPLASLSLWLDHSLWRGQPVGYHATNLAWFTLLLLAVHRLYRRLRIPPRTAWLALWLFAVADSTLMPVGWLANRNSLLTALFGVVAASLALPKAHEPHRSRVSGMAAIACALLACMCKESGVVFLAIIAAARMVPIGHGAFTAGRRSRIPGIAVVSVAIAVMFVLALALAGYGAKCDFYGTPWTAPAMYATRLLALMTAGMVSLAAWIPLDGLAHQPQWVWPAIICTTPITIWSGTVIFRRIRRHPSCRFLLVWIVLTLLPQAGAPLSERLLFLPSIGSAAILALFITSVRHANPHRRVPKLHRLLATVLFAFGALVAPWIAVGSGIFTVHLARRVREPIITADVGPTALGQREVFILNASTGLIPFNAIATWIIETGDDKVRFWGMQYGRRAIRWTRIDERTFDLESLDEPFIHNLLERVFREHADPPVEGERFETALFQVRIINVDETGLRRFRVTCPESLDIPRYRFLLFRDGRLRHAPPPAIGESVDYESVKPLVAMLP